MYLIIFEIIFIKIKNILFYFILSITVTLFMVSSLSSSNHNHLFSYLSESTVSTNIWWVLILSFIKLYEQAIYFIVIDGISFVFVW